jgi:hypothetical protein
MGSLGTVAAIGLSHSWIGRVTVTMVMMLVMSSAGITSVLLSVLLSVLRISAILGPVATVVVAYNHEKTNE